MNIGSYGVYTNKFIQTSNASRDNVNFGNGDVVKLVEKSAAKVDADGIDHAGIQITPSVFRSDQSVEFKEEDIPRWQQALSVLADHLGIGKTAKFHQ